MGGPCDKEKCQDISKKILLAQPLGNRRRGNQDFAGGMNILECLEYGTGGYGHEIVIIGKDSLRRPRLADELWSQ